MLSNFDRLQQQIFRERAFILDVLYQDQVDSVAIMNMLYQVDALERRRARICRSFRIRVMQRLRRVTEAPLFGESSSEDEEEEEEDEVSQPNQAQVEADQERGRGTEERTIDFQCCICFEDRDLHESSSLSCHGSVVCNSCAHNQTGQNPICKRINTRNGIMEAWNLYLLLW